MKKLRILSIMMLAVAMMPLMVACGGDDDGGGTPPNNGGSNGIVAGRKIKQLEIEDYMSMALDREPQRFVVTYDNNGRLSKLTTWKDFKITYPQYYEYLETPPEDSYSIVSEQIDIFSIDYDFNVIRYYDGTNSSFYNGVYYVVNPNYTHIYNSCYFRYNERGYISQIAGYNLTYNAEGYLTNVTNSGEMWSFAYSNGDVVKALLDALQSGQAKMYYVSYDQSSSAGDVIFNITVPRKYSWTDSYGSWWQSPSFRKVAFFIAYQAGLFGNISKHCTYLSNDNSTAVVNQNFEDNSMLYLKCSVVYE